MCKLGSRKLRDTHHIDTPFEKKGRALRLCTLSKQPQDPVMVEVNTFQSLICVTVGVRGRSKYLVTINMQKGLF